MHFSFVKLTLHPNRIVPTKKAAKHKFGIKTSSVHTSHKITHQSHLNPVMTSMLVPAPAQHMPANRSLGLRSWCAAPRPSAVLCSKDHMGMSLLNRRVGRCKSSLGSTCPVSPRHIPSQTHSPQLAARISAGFFAQPAAGVAGVAAGRLLWLAS